LDSETQWRLRDYLRGLLPLLGRRDRQRWGEVYIRGILSPEVKRKTAAAMAQKLPGGDKQSLQQFVGQSPWDWMPLRETLARQLVKALSPVPAWIVDDTGFPKKGDHSVGVARQFNRTLGKVENCQVAVSLNYATEEACAPLDFELYLPEDWIHDGERRRKAGIPSGVTFQQKWKLALNCVERALAWGVPRGVVVADASYGDVFEFRHGLARRGLMYVVGIDSSSRVWTDQLASRRGDLKAPRSVLQVVQELPPEAWRVVAWREGPRGVQESRFAALRVRPEHPRGRGGQAMAWLLAEWPPVERGPDRVWLSNLPEDTSLAELSYWAKSRWWLERNFEQMKEELGLDHYEGRGWPGWHHHVTLTMVGHSFLVLERLRSTRKYWVDTPREMVGDQQFRPKT